MCVCAGLFFSGISSWEKVHVLRTFFATNGYEPQLEVPFPVQVSAAASGASAESTQEPLLNKPFCGVAVLASNLVIVISIVR